jgi:hypothetical protein
MKAQGAGKVVAHLHIVGIEQQSPVDPFARPFALAEAGQSEHTERQDVAVAAIPGQHFSARCKVNSAVRRVIGVAALTTKC